MKKSIYAFAVLAFSMWDLAVAQNTFPASGDAVINGNLTIGNYKNIIGGFGAISTSGVQDFNDISVARSGNSYSLLTPTALNSPHPGFYHSLSFEYHTKDGSGNLTQFAVPYYSATANSGYYYRTRYANIFTPWMRILTENTSGNVGIGTVSPTEKVEVSSNSNTFIKLTTESQSNAIFSGIHLSHKRPNSTIFSNHRIYSDQFNLRFEIDESATFKNNGIYTLTLGANNTVGIGTTTPDRKLVVSGDIGFDYGDTRSHNGIRRNGIATEYFNNITGTGTNVIHRFTGSGGTTKLFITEGGSVGIGASVIPAGYKLAVNGHAIAEKMIIRINENWPDYVFADNYQLPQLSETEAYVKKHKHLPEMPSASDIEKNGQDLAEINKLLLKKVEELTLYLIDERKVNQKQQEEINELRQLVKSRE